MGHSQEESTDFIWLQKKAGTNIIVWKSSFQEKGGTKWLREDRTSPPRGLVDYGHAVDQLEKNCKKAQSRKKSTSVKRNQKKQKKRGKGWGYIIPPVTTNQQKKGKGAASKLAIGEHRKNGLGSM